MVKKKKEGDPIAHQPEIDYSATASSCSGDDTSDDDYIVFEDDGSTTISDPCWSDIDSDEDSESSAEDSDDDTDSCGSSASPNPPTLVINIRQMVHTVHDPSKHVRFSNEIVTHVIEIEDRKGYWTEDRFRFQQRCTSVRDAISFIFDEVHRRKMRLIVNLSDTLRGAIMPYSSGGIYGELKHTDRSFNPTICSYSNISRDHSTTMRPMYVVTKRPYAIALGGFAASGAQHPPMPTWWRS